MTKNPLELNKDSGSEGSAQQERERHTRELVNARELLVVEWNGLIREESQLVSMGPTALDRLTQIQERQRAIIKEQGELEQQIAKLMQ